MATVKKKPVSYEVHGTVTKISAVSRAAVKIRDNYYTIEASEERTITDPDTADMKKEWKALFDEINEIVDAQTGDIVKMFEKRG